MIIDSNNNNVIKTGKSFCELTPKEQIEKLKKRKANFAKEMHDESDQGDKARFANDITLINLTILKLQEKLSN